MPLLKRPRREQAACGDKANLTSDSLTTDSLTSDLKVRWQWQFPSNALRVDILLLCLINTVGSGASARSAAMAL
jgi:hypothetical protein